MSPILLFGLLLLLTFGVIIWILRPSRTEVDVQRHLSEIGRIHSFEADSETILRQENLSAIPWLDQLLQYIPRARDLQLLIAQAGLNWTVASVLFGSIGAALLAGLGASMFVPLVPLGIIISGVAGFAPYAFLLWKRSSRFQRFEQVLPEAIDLMSQNV